MTLRGEKPVQHLGDALSDPEAGPSGRNGGDALEPDYCSGSAPSDGERAPQAHPCPCECGEMVTPGPRRKKWATRACATRGWRKRRESARVTSHTIEGGSEPCTPTTSGTTYLHLVVSGPPSPAKRSPSSISISPPPALAPLRPSCVSSAPAINELTIARLRREIPSPADVRAELEDEWRELDGRRLARGRLGGGHVTARCPGCKAFVRNPNAPHECGYMPGLGWAA